MNIRFPHLLLAMLVHALLAAFLLVGVQCSRQMQAPVAIQGVLISSQPPKPVTAPQPPQPEAPPKPDQADAQLQQQEQARQREQQAEQQKHQQDEEAAQRALVAQQRQQELQQKEQLAQQKAKEVEAQQRAVEAQKQAAEADVARKLAEETKQKAALAAKQKAEADQKAKELAAKKASDQKEREEELQAALGAQDQQQIVNEWGAQVTSAITRAWSYIAGSEGLHCKIRIRLAPTGEVLSVDVVDKSGNELFDQSAQRAAYKASPLPLPSDPTVFQSRINVCFAPGGGSCQ